MKLFLAMTVLISGVSAAQGRVSEPWANTPAQGHWAELGRTAQEGLRQNLAMDRSGARPRGVMLGGLSSVGGVMQQVLVPVSFKDMAALADSATLSSRYYGAGSATDASVTSYYKEVSGGKFTVHGTVSSGVTLPQTGAAYVGGRANGVGDNVKSFVLDALTRVDNLVDWRPLADTTDSLYRVPGVVLVQPGSGGECSNPSALWSHRYTLTALTGAPYTTHSSINGRPVVIDNYIVTSAQDCTGAANGVGTVVHETGHLLGLPDLYNTNTTTSTGPVGDWDLMATGNYNTLRMPSWLGAWSRSAMGWSTIAVLDSGSTTLSDVETGGSVVAIPYGNMTTALLLERRNNTGSDKFAHGSGVILWNIDAARLSQGYLLQNQVNTGGVGVRVVEADGRRDMEQGVDYGDASDVWQSGTYGSGTSPAWAGGSGIVSIQGSVVSLQKTNNANSGLFTPDTLATAVAGMAYSATFKRTGLDSTSSVTWVLDTVALARVGLKATVVGGQVSLSGTLPDSATTVLLNVGADSLSGTVLIPVLADPHLTIDALASAVLGGGAISGDAISFYDRRGNNNGLLDVGDVAAAVKQGIVSLDAKTALAKNILRIINTRQAVH